MTQGGKPGPFFGGKRSLFVRKKGVLKRKGEEKTRHHSGRKKELKIIKEEARCFERSFFLHSPDEKKSYWYHSKKEKYSSAFIKEGGKIAPRESNALLGGWPGSFWRVPC